MGNLNAKSDVNMMASAVMYRLRYADRYTLLGLGMLATAILLMLITALSQHTNTQLQTALSQPVQTTVPKVREHAPADMTQKFYALLPEEHQADAISAQILRSADSLGMVFEHAEFKTVPVQNAPFESAALENTPLESAHLQGNKLIAQHIKLPLTGNYVQVRQFLNALLNAYPSLALTTLDLQRDNALSDQVQAQIEFTLYLRKDLDKHLHKRLPKEQS